LERVPTKMKIECTINKETEERVMSSIEAQLNDGISFWMPEITDLSLSVVPFYFYQLKRSLSCLSRVRGKTLV
jgi:hypothetical protein